MKPLSVKLGALYSFYETDKWGEPLKLIKFTRTWCGWAHFEKEDGTPFVIGSRQFAQLGRFSLVKRI